MSNPLEQHLAALRQSVGYANAQARQAVGQAQTQQGVNAQMQSQLQQMQRNIDNLSQALTSVSASASGDAEHVKYIEQIPGRRVPFDLMVNIDIGSNITAEQQASVTVSQDGPFVAVARFATFRSSHTFTYTDPATSAVASFNGRSYGRFRPIHSAWDLNDGQLGVQPVVGGALPGTGAPAYVSPSNHSSFRTMEFDGVIEFLNQGAAFQRQNIALPSSFYTQEINSPFLLGALDFFERGEVLQWKVTPTHVNNPPAGNLRGYAATAAFPFIDSQYDVHEGISDPSTVGAQSTDPATRLPNGILTIGFHGYRIIQPPGTVGMV